MFKKILPQKPIHYFLLAMFLFIFLSSLTIFIENRGINSLCFRNNEDFFADTFNIYNYLSSKNIYSGDSGWTRGYYGFMLPRVFRNQPPMTYLCFDIIRHLSHARNTHLFLSVYISILLCFPLFYLLYYRLKAMEMEKILFCGSLLFSSVFISSLERGNIIWISVLGITFFYYFQQSKKPYLREIALLFLAMAAAIKVYPALLGLILVSQKQWHRCVRLLVYGCLLSFLPFLYFPGGFSLIPDMLFNVFSTGSIEQPACLLFSSWIPYIQKFSPSSSAGMLRHQLYLFGILMSIVCIILAHFQQEYWRKILLMTLPLLLAPKIGGSYNLLYLFPCMVLFFNEGGNDIRSRIMAVLFAGIIVPAILPSAISKLGFSSVNSIALDLLFVFVLATSISNILRRSQQWPRSISGDKICSKLH